QPAVALVVMSGQQPPRLAVAVAAMRTHRLHHSADELIRQLLLAAVTHQPEPFGRSHVAADCLAIQLRQPLHRTQTLAAQPQAQHLTNLEHTNLPERHRRPSVTTAQTAAIRPTAAPAPVDPRVVPSLAKRWSHAPGETHLTAVPCRWRATFAQRAYEELTRALLDDYA